MTRENKVALVVGFGLVLLVGILISDHLASARAPRPPDLVQARGEHDAPDPDLRLVDLSGRREVTPPPEPPVHRPITQAAELPAAPVAQPAAPPEAAPAARPTVQSPTPRDPVHPPSGDKLHVVEPGDTLAGISRRYYDAESFAAALAGYNGMADPDLVIAGRSLRIPPIQALGGAAPAQAAPDGAPAPGTHVVKPGETLSEIAQRLLGSARRADELFELNRSVLSDPDAIRAGMTLRLP